MINKMLNYLKNKYLNKSAYLYYVDIIIIMLIYI